MSNVKFDLVNEKRPFDVLLHDVFAVSLERTAHELEYILEFVEDDDASTARQRAGLDDPDVAKAVDLILRTIGLCDLKRLDNLVVEALRRGLERLFVALIIAKNRINNETEKNIS